MSLAKVPTLFKCPTCGKDFSTHASLRRHREKHKDKLHACDQCEKKYSWRTALFRHKQTAHAAAGQFECDTCGKICPHKTALYDHKRYHRETHNGKLHECDQCERKYKWRGNLLNHKRIAHPEGERGPLEGDECGKLYPHGRALYDHKRGVHDQFDYVETHTGQRCECDMCGKVYTNSPALDNYKWRGHSEAPHRCEYCGKTFGFACRLRAHMVIHGEKREEYQCARCPRRFKSHNGLTHHVSTEHSGILPGFGLNSREHPLDTRFTCDSECGLHFATRSEYLGHLQSRHAQEHPLTCKCVTIDVMMAKRVATNLVSTAFVEADGTMKCIDGDCSFETTCARQMESHKEQRHHNAYQPVLRCRSCQTWFTSPGNLKRHNAENHQRERRFKCDDCGYITCLKAHFIGHLTSCHHAKAEKQLQLIDEAFTQLMDCCVAPMTTGLTAAAVQKAPAVTKACVEPFEALVAECLKKQASAQRTHQQAPMSTGMSSLLYTASASTHHGQPTANTAASSLSSAPDGSHQQPSMSTGMSSSVASNCLYQCYFFA
ncbi:zinc finger protein [Aphelenchoides avenae]|nr:zinc finger protein [Aphelenchus avenae]